VQDGDKIEIIVDRQRLTGSVNLIGTADGQQLDAAQAAAVLDARPTHPQLRPNAQLPDDTRLWAALQQVGGGTWGGCVYDVEEIIKRLKG
jgi:dihydroxyacid dehydratase/phosphogluconate dehydratase